MKKAGQKGDAYSTDLRQKVLTAKDENGWTQEEAGKFFGVGEATIYRWERLKRETGSVEPRLHGGGAPRKVLEEHELALCQLIHEKNDYTIADLQKALAERTGLNVSDSAVWDAVDRLGLTLKKKTLTASEQDRPDVVQQRKEFKREMSKLDPEDLVFLDEAGSTIAMTPFRARSPKGERALGKVPRCRGVVTTILGALTLAGVTALMTIEGATCGEVFSAFAREVLAPTLRPGNIVVLDNLAAHRVQGAREAVEAVGARFLFLPPYSPDLNPIEETWSKMKGHIRKQEPRTITQLDTSIADAARHVTTEDAAGWIQHAGYHVNR